MHRFKLKAYQWVLVGTGVLLFGLIVLQLNAPQSPDWRPSFERNSRVPLGTLGIYKQLASMRADYYFEERDMPVIEYNERYESEYEEQYSGDTNTDGEVEVQQEVEPTETVELSNSDRRVWLYINENLGFDQYEIEILQRLVFHGDFVFLSAESFSSALLDSLGLNELYSFPQFDLSKRESVLLLDSQQFAPYRFELLKLGYGSAFTLTDSVNNKVIGFNEQHEPNLVLHRHGKGYFVIHGQVAAYTNVSMADSKSFGYAFSALSYLPWEAQWIWDDYYKTGRYIVRTPLRYILRMPALRWAWYILIAGGLLFMIFYGKRRQRPIPIIKPPENASLEFAETMGSFYLHNGNHADIIAKKMRFFADYIQRKFMIRYQPEAPDFVTQLSSKSGVSDKLIKRIVNCDLYARTHPELSQAFLMDVNALLENFYEQTRTSASLMGKG